MKFDKYFYYAIDHKGREPGSMIPGCQSPRDCDGPRRGGRMEDNYCCAHAQIHDMKHDKKHDLMRCMDK